MLSIAHKSEHFENEFYVPVIAGGCNDVKNRTIEIIIPGL